MTFRRINNIISKNLKGSTVKTFRHIVLLFIIGILTLGLMYNAKSELYRYEYSDLSAWGVYFGIIVSVIYINLFILVPRFLLKGKLVNYLLFIVLCIITALFLIVLTQNLLFINTGNNEFGSLLINLIGNIVSIGLVIISTSIFSLFRWWKEYNQYINELETSTIEAELNQLKNQINPHFLFNTINNANIKVEKDSESAYNIITKLEDLLRYQLTDTSNKKIHLKDDIAFLSDYLELEKTRRTKFNYTISTDDNLSDIEVFPMLFIPFVENAVKHSLTAKGESRIRIVLLKEKGFLHFHCENTKPPISIKRNGGGLGLKNIRRRLDLLYQSSYTLDIIESEDNYKVNLYLKI